MEESRVVNARCSLDTPQSHAAAVHSQAERLHVFGILPGSIRFEELAATVFALVALSPLAMAILPNLCTVTRWAFHGFTCQHASFGFQQHFCKKCFITKSAFLGSMNLSNDVVNVV